MSVMLSHQHGTAQARFPTHRRQSSTPTAIEAARIPAVTALALHEFQKSHRRGQSLDQRPLHPQQFQAAPERLAPTNAAAYTTSHHLHYQPAAPDFSTLMTISMLAQQAQFPRGNHLQSIDHLDTSPAAPNTANAENGGLESESLRLALSRIQQEQQFRQSGLPYGGVQHALPSPTWRMRQQDNLAEFQHLASNGHHEVRRASIESNISQGTQPRAPVFRSNDSKCSQIRAKPP